MCKSNLYSLRVWYGGNFVHIPEKSCTSKSVKLFTDVDLQNMNVDELKNNLGSILGEYDSLFFLKDGIYISLGVSLLSNESFTNMLKLADANNKVVRLNVYL